MHCTAKHHQKSFMLNATAKDNFQGQDQHRGLVKQGKGQGHGQLAPRSLKTKANKKGL